MTDRPEELLLWLDLETTGLDPELDEIIEVGAILTTTDLDELAHWRDLVTPTPRAFIRMMRDETVRTMHEESGLLDDLADETGWHPPSSAEKSVLHWIDYHAGEGTRIVLCGSNTGRFDHRFLQRWMPRLAARVHYHDLDAGSWRKASQLWGDGSLAMSPETPHRALDDARAALNLARQVKTLLAGPPVPEVPAGEPTYIYRDGRTDNQWSAMLARTNDTNDWAEVLDVDTGEWVPGTLARQGDFKERIQSRYVFRIVRGGAP